MTTGTRGGRWPPRRGRGDPDPVAEWPPPVEWAGAIGDISRSLAALVPGAVLGSATYLLDAQGTAADQYRVPFAALCVTSLSAAPLTIAAQPRSSAAPRSGPGVALVAPGACKVCHMRGTVWSIYGGNPGDAVMVEAFTRPVPPAGTAQGNGLTVANVPGGSLAVVATPVHGQGAAAAFAAAGNGTATLPAGLALSGFTVTFQGFGTTNTPTVTVTGAQGGTLTYQVELSTTEAPAWNFAEIMAPPLAPANPLVGIAVTWTGNVNSPAGNIAVYGSP